MKIFRKRYTVYKTTMDEIDKDFDMCKNLEIPLGCPIGSHWKLKDAIECYYMMYAFRSLVHDKYDRTVFYIFDNWKKEFVKKEGA